MASIKGLINKLPEDLQPIASQYVSALNDMADSELRAFVDLVIAGSWSSAFKVITTRMTTEELLSEIERINKNLKTMNIENAEYVMLQANLIKEFLVTSLLLSKAKIGV